MTASLDTDTEAPITSGGCKHPSRISEAKDSNKLNLLEITI